MSFLFGKKAADVKIRVSVEGDLHRTPQSHIKGCIFVCVSDATVEATQLRVSLRGRSIFTGKNKKEVFEDFYHSPDVALLPQKSGKKPSTTKLKPGNYQYAFALPPPNRTLAPSCCLRRNDCNIISICYEVVCAIDFPNAPPSPYVAASEVFMHSLVAPPPPCLSKTTIKQQKFLTHPPIRYSITIDEYNLHCGDAIALFVEIVNESRMSVEKAHVKLMQRWSWGEGNKNKAEYCCTEFALNAAPMFPVPSKQTSKNSVKFKVAPDLAPSVPRHSQAFPTGTSTEVLYFVDFIFHTSKNDQFTVSVPITILDAHARKKETFAPEVIAMAPADTDLVQTASLPPSALPPSGPYAPAMKNVQSLSYSTGSEQDRSETASPLMEQPQSPVSYPSPALSRAQPPATNPASNAPESSDAAPFPYVVPMPTHVMVPLQVPTDQQSQQQPQQQQPQQRLYPQLPSLYS